jgi:hypothetical protein
MIVKQPEANRKIPDKGLFKKRVVHTKFDIYVFYDHWVDTSGGGLLVSEGIIRPVGDIRRFWLSCLSSLVFLVQKILKLFGFQIHWL